MSRTRSMGSFTSSHSIRGGSANGVPWAESYDTYQDTDGKVKTMTDDSDSLFYRNQRKGVLTIRPFSMKEVSRSPGDGSSGANGTVEPWYINWGRGDMISHFTGLLTEQYSSESIAVARAAVSAHADVTKTSTLSPVSLYELGKTRDMFMKAGKRAVDARNAILKFHREVSQGKHPGFLRKWRKETGRQVFELADSASTLWLEYRYGWLPLYYDISGTIKAFNQQRRPWSEARGSATTTDSWSNDFETGYSGFGGHVGYKFRDVYTDTVTARCGVYYCDDMSPEKRLAENLGITLSHTPSVLWEVTPWSFVIDWFIDVGSWLEAIRPRADVRYLGSWTSIKHQVTAQRYPTGSYCTGQATTYISSSAQTLSVLHKMRYPTCSVPPLPTLGTGLTSTVRQISAAALAFQQLKRLVKRK